MLIVIKEQYYMYKHELYEYVISFRKINQFKMELEAFKLNLFIFREIFRHAFNHSDF